MEKSILKQFCNYTFFGVLGMVGLSVYILADTFFISKALGTNGLAALNLAIPVYSLIHGTGLLLGTGGATKFAIYSGQKDSKSANVIFTNTLYLTAFFSLLFMLLGVFLSKKVTAMLGADSVVFTMTNTYIKILLLFSPAFLLNNVLICFVRNDKKPQLAMAAMLTSSFSNILLDYIFMFPMKMGIFGAVFATSLSPILSMLLLSRHCLSSAKTFHIIKTVPCLNSVKWIFLMGFPSFIAQISSGIVMMTFNKIILSLQGNVGIAAYGVIANLALVMTSVFSGIEQGAQPLFSRFYGCGQKQNIAKVLQYAMITVLGSALLIYVAVFVYAESIVSIFNSENNLSMQYIAVRGLKLYFIASFFVGINTVLSIFFVSTENVLPAHIISLLRGLILIVPIAFVLSALCAIVGVWISYAVTEGIVCLIAIFFYYKIKSKIF